MTQSVVVIDPSDGSEIDYTANYRPDKGMEIGGEAFNGETDSGGTIVFDDTAGLIVNRDDLAHGRRIIIREDASGGDIPIHMGRISPRSQYRDIEVADRARSITITTRDQNADLSGIIVDGWSRPAEEPFERIQALLAAYLNGSSSTELNPDGEPWGRASTVIGDGFVNTTPLGTDMPAKDYVETDPREVIRDCCEWAGYDAFVILNDDETLDLFFDDRTGTAYTSTLSISDNDAQVDDTLCFAPIWDLGPAHELDGSEQATGLLLIGGDESRTYDNRPAVEVVNDKWEYVDRSEATEQADLNNNIVALLNARQEEELRIQFSMLVPADSIHLLRPGMRMEVKRAYAAGIGTPTYFRAVQVRYRWISHEYYMVGVYLGYPVKLVRRYGDGRTVPTPPEPGNPFAPGTLVGEACSNSGTNVASDYAPWSGDNEENVEITTGGAIAAGTTLFALVSTNIDGGHDTVVYDEKGNTWTKDAQSTAQGSSDIVAQVWRTTLTTGLAGGDYIRFAGNLGASILPQGEMGGRCIKVWSATGSVSNPTVTASSRGFSSAPALAASTGDFVIMALVWGPNVSSTLTDDADWTDIGTYGQIAGTGKQATGLYGGYLEDAAAEAWTGTLSANFDWTAIAVAYDAGGSSTSDIGTVGGTGSGASGPPGNYIPVGSTLEHENITNGGPYHMAEDVTIADSGGHFTSQNVEGALQELATGSSGLPWFIVTAYGAVGDGTTDDTSAINAAIAALIAAGGGVLYFPYGTYLVSDALDDLSVGCLVMGDVRTSIVCSSATADLFTVTGFGVKITNLSLDNSAATPSAGAGIRIHALATRIEHVTITDFYDAIAVDGDAAWTIENCHIFEPVRYGIYVRNISVADEGNWVLDGVTLIANSTPDAAIRIESSGGGKLSNVKVDGSFDYGIDLAVSGTTQTGILQVVNCSFENTTSHGINATVATGSSRWREIIISGNQFGLWSNNTAKAISLVSTDAGDLQYIVIANNVMSTTGTPRSAIQLTNCDEVVLVGNITGQDYTSLYTNSGSTNVVEVGGAGAAALDDLSDVAITSPEADQQLQYVGGTWVNNHRRWEPVVTDTGSGPELVFDGTGDIVMTWADYS